ncbi:MAG TPA: bifunctional glutamate N-acetyltransferase/amino-acid acetyltransferase ArgJ [Vicinamibacterales bacterium]|nr:bifunctional glutamate N-acetyltransferase/amino-acid acetyltransferase ArgJ [Vicinamibacterales bacterium]
MSGLNAAAAGVAELSVVEGGVGAPAGFRTSGVHCGIKTTAGALDLTVIASDTTAAAAGIFTTNLAVAAPVTVSRRHLAETGGRARAVVVNSGCANACTGGEGLANAERMAEETARTLGCSRSEVLVASTGVIGVGLPIDRVITGIQSASRTLARDKGSETARAIMTTDPFPKEHAVVVQTSRGSFVVGGTAKGSGMIEPNMATMLGFLTTDAKVSPGRLHQALVASAYDTFNAITVDGECSTNDCLIALASGASGIDIDDDTLPLLTAGMREVSRILALGVVRGGEGATKVIEVTVCNASSDADARQVARTIANSPLVKTAVHGADPNWGRIVAAAGRSGVTFDVGRATVHVGGVLLFENGMPHDDAAPDAGKHLEGTDVRIEMSLGTGGNRSATIWTCDLSAEYVRINGEYRT